MCKRLRDAVYAITAACTSPTQTASVAPPAPKQRILAPEPAAAVPVQRAVREVEKIREGLTTEEVCRVLKQLVWASACPACCAVRKVILCVMCSGLSRTFRVDANVCAEQVNTFTTAVTNSPSPIFSTSVVHFSTNPQLQFFTRYVRAVHR